jgi:hypothetical protein
MYLTILAGHQRFVVMFRNILKEMMHPFLMQLTSLGLLDGQEQSRFQKEVNFATFMLETE